MKKYALFLLFFSLPLFIAAKTGTLTGTIRNQQGEAAVDVNVFILKSADSSLVATAITDEKGNYVVEVLVDGSYLVRAAQSWQAVTIQGANIKAPDMVIALNKKEIKEVTVRTQKPMIEVRADRIIVNVENSVVNAGSTVLEVLQRSPGVTVDQDEQIKLKGKQGVLIMMDGKPVPMQGSDLANLLKSMPAASVEKIELISNPGARYDAAGAAGIINIKTKKDRNIGTNGSATLGVGHGIYPKANAGFNLNYRNKKFNAYANYNVARREGKNELLLYRQFDSNKVYKFAYDQHNFANILQWLHYMNAGVDYSITKKTTVGLMLNGGMTDHHLSSNNNALVLNEQRLMTSYFNNTVDNKSFNINYAINLNLRHSFDTTGRELSVDVDYGNYRSRTRQDINTSYHYADGAPMGNPALLSGRLNGITDIRSLKADYVQPLAHDVKVEAGFKTSYVTADNDPSFYDQSNGYEVFDSSKSNHFIYKENINAAYINANKDWKKWSVQLGLRAEQTLAKGHQLVNDVTFNRNYTQLFPNIAVTHHVDAKNDVGITLGRRIDRPTYQQLNPFRDYLDVSSIHQGNPYLNPAFTYTAELSHIYDGRFVTQLAYSRTTNAITQVIVPSEDNPNVTLITDRNLATNSVYSLSGSYPLQVCKWWNSTNSIAAYYSHYDGNVANTPLNDGVWTANFYSQNVFTLPGAFTAEFTGWYQAPQRYGYMVLKANSGISLGVQKSFFDKKATARFNVTDLLYHSNPVGYSDFNGYHEDFVVRRDSRVATLTFTYRFGKRTIPGTRRRQRGAEDELKRAGSNGSA